jgi:hypothetical protein
MNKPGVIHEQGDYGIFQNLNRADRKQYEREQNQRPVNESAYKGGQIRLGDCSHLDKNR